jgi:glycosyltransferase involved in cell wall biosynthesis
MAPHKGIETLVEAVRDVRDRHGIPARLRLVGEWPDRRYEVRIRLAAGALAGAVEFAGHLPRADLVAAYRRAAVFCLLSRCESFGIPGLEAQACGTPVVCSAVGGLPEVYGEGAVCVPVDEPEAAAAALADLLSDRGRWQRLAAAALRNAARFDPEEVSRPLMRMFEPGADPGEGER